MPAPLSNSLTRRLPRLLRARQSGREALHRGQIRHLSQLRRPNRGPPLAGGHKDSSRSTERHRPHPGLREGPHKLGRRRAPGRDRSADPRWPGVPGARPRGREGRRLSGEATPEAWEIVGCHGATRHRARTDARGRRTCEPVTAATLLDRRFSLDRNSNRGSAERRSPSMGTLPRHVQVGHGTSGAPDHDGRGLRPQGDQHIGIEQVHGARSKALLFHDLVNHFTSHPLCSSPFEDGKPMCIQLHRGIHVGMRLKGNLPLQGVLDHGSQGRSPSSRHRFGRHEKLVRQLDGRLHMG
jgi:hypothetical protein